jgi:hypothetical protein
MPSMSTSLSRGSLVTASSVAGVVTLIAVIVRTQESAADTVGPAEAALRRRIDRWTRHGARRHIAAAAGLILLGYGGFNLPVIASWRLALGDQSRRRAGPLA